MEKREIFMKNKQGVISLIDINLYPKITFEDGIIIIGIVNPTRVYNIND